MLSVMSALPYFRNFSIASLKSTEILFVEFFLTSELPGTSLFSVYISVMKS